MNHQEYIRIRGARENNLKNVSLDIPKRKITIFTGVSGSGKSSIVFDTIGAEAQRQLNETFSMFIRNRLPRISQPEADAIENLSTSIVIDQKRLGGNSRSTMGTITDISAVMRLLFSRLGQPHAGFSNAFSFNDPAGMCPECNGLGKKVEIDLEKFLDPTKSLNEGAILFPLYAVGTWYWKAYTFSGMLDNDKKLEDYSDEEMHTLLYGKGTYESNYNGMTFDTKYEGLVDKFNRLYIQKDSSEISEKTVKKVERFLKMGDCPACKGARLNEKALASRINGLNIAEMSAMEVSELVKIIREIKDPVSKPMIDTLTERLEHLVDIGLGYLSLDRETGTLSGGESQRIKMVKHLNSSLIDITYIFDEPSIGLHPRDVHRLNELLQKLRDKGNTILVVEHDPDVIRVADYIVDVGPKAGSGGGEIVYSGDYKGLLQAPTLTGRFINRDLKVKSTFRQPTGALKVRNAKRHNLKNVSVDIPTGVFTVVTGVAGSGKSSLINGVFLSQHPEAIVIDQSAVGTSIRSNPATYTGIMDDIRKLFGKTNKVSASLFSFNSDGACPECQGLGFIFTDLAFLEPVKTVCETCEGKRFKPEVLEYKVNGKSITDVLDMSVEEALAFFKTKEVIHKLTAMNQVGLNYLTLGQPLSTLSGGECQRIKLAGELHKNGTIYVMDEPTTGLHMSDTGHLLEIIDHLVDQGNSVIVIEHNTEVMKHADWIIDLGPEGGHKGGQILFEGTPADLLKSRESLTAEYLRGGAKVG
ncbi:excinuclease UvrABC ATPase subunit [Dyadobacter sp. BE34]|uniref:UvrABC system protein A n=1 Tax=Dyadobacter fermentans TaxID=94254 RepID=A0ABU1QWA6_9BACT|nr:MULTISPECIES: excinuclease ABC subunit UvrA [Dyadobacter]MDR6805447.1 excinuclease UvrABC ATPase subunit [Dyadobacter fermentans]MDR7042793.1 excinuclease UvrABC ATPase subunit [Dyadobacter sp. BE242]MDR7197105.1 excinuclease UvrABC ATPase subunit [Dyadobacter sp. BE34]MDR7215460.1 excinuclease UvrABC ATPase subunit [Dyadobacter sp. BE31]MDR7262996.1 excinuclease UvrABC ATPase subunit [Dyadobacter sp. BE32]